MHASFAGVKFDLERLNRPILGPCAVQPIKWKTARCFPFKWGV